MSEIVREVRISSAWREYAEREFSLPGGHSLDAWSMARSAKCRLAYFDDGRAYHRGRPAKRPTPEDVAECEAVLRQMWREGLVRPMYNTYHHHGHREYIAYNPERTPYPQGPRMTDCWEDIEAISEHIE